MKLVYLLIIILAILIWVPTVALIIIVEVCLVVAIIKVVLESLSQE